MSPEVFEPVKPVRVFDDLYYIGNQLIGIHILKTSAGLVLIEAMDKSDILEKFYIPGIKELGLENEPVLALLLTHGHFDHIGGAYAIQNYTGCKVGMSLEDAAYMVSCDENTGENRVDVPYVNMILKHDKDYMFGDHTIYVQFGPGHTPGCLNFFFDIHDHGIKHRVAMMGGYGVFGPGQYEGGKEYPYSLQYAVDNAFTFAASCVKFWEYCKATDCDIYMNPHPHLCEFFEHLEADQHRAAGDKTAFAIGLEGIREWVLDRYDVCTISASAFTDLVKK